MDHTPFPSLTSQEEELQFIIQKFNEFGIILNPVFSLNDLKNTELWDMVGELRGPELAYQLFWIYGYSWFVPNKKEIAPVSHNVWYIDMEFDSEVRYDNMLLSLNRLMGNQFDFQNVTNVFVDDTQTDGLIFDLCGVQYNLKFKYDNDWADPLFFESIGKIIKPYIAKNIYKVYEGQGGIYVYLTREEMINVSNFLHFKGEMMLVV